MKFQQYLTEKLIVVGKGANYGQIMFLAGGAGSGKGFSISNFIEGNKFKIRDVDEMKNLVVKLMKIKGENPEIANANFKNPKDVFRVHEFVKAMGIKDYSLDLLLQGAKEGRLPNIIFDVTMKDVGDITEVMPKLLEIGYEPKNIHLTWVLAEYHVAIEQNKNRARVVPDHILLKTHEGAAQTVTDLIRGKIKAIGSTIDGQVNIILAGGNNTVYMTTMDTPDTIKGKDKYTQLDGEKLKTSSGKDVIKSFKYINIKEEGKPMKSQQDLEKNMLTWDDLKKWINDSIPKTTATRNIRRRKGI